MLAGLAAVNATASEQAQGEQRSDPYRRASDRRPRRVARFERSPAVVEPARPDAAAPPAQPGPARLHPRRDLPPFRPRPARPCAGRSARARRRLRRRDPVRAAGAPGRQGHRGRPRAGQHRGRDAARRAAGLSIDYRAATVEDVAAGGERSTSCWPWRWSSTSATWRLPGACCAAVTPGGLLCRDHQPDAAALRAGDRRRRVRARLAAPRHPRGTSSSPRTSCGDSSVPRGSAVSTPRRGYDPLDRRLEPRGRHGGQLHATAAERAGARAMSMIPVTRRPSPWTSERDRGDFVARRRDPAGRTSTRSRRPLSCASTWRRSPALPERVRTAAGELGRQPADADGVLVITAQRYRTQERNRQDALERLLGLIRRAATPSGRGVPTKPTFASRLRRREAETRRAGQEAAGRRAGHGVRRPAPPPARMVARVTAGSPRVDPDVVLARCGA